MLLLCSLGLCGSAQMFSFCFSNLMKCDPGWLLCCPRSCFRFYNGRYSLVIESLGLSESLGVKSRKRRQETWLFDISIWAHVCHALQEASCRLPSLDL